MIKFWVQLYEPNLALLAKTDYDHACSGESCNSFSDLDVDLLR